MAAQGFNFTLLQDLNNKKPCDSSEYEKTLNPNSQHNFSPVFNNKHKIAALHVYQLFRFVLQPHAMHNFRRIVDCIE